MPLGVMVGYIIAAISLSIAQTSETCAGLLCWRWPILIEVFLLMPLYVGLYFVPSEHISLHLGKLRHSNRRSGAGNNSQSNSGSLKDRSESESSLTSSNHHPIFQTNLDIDQQTPILGESKKSHSLNDFTPLKVMLFLIFS